jgi:integrase
LKKLKFPGAVEFYKEINMKQDMRNATSVRPFIQHMTGKMFNPNKITIEQFTEFVNGLSKWVHELPYKMHQRLAIKIDIKKLLSVYYKGNTKESTNPFVLAWKAANLFWETSDFAEHAAYTEALIKKKATNVLHIPQEVAENFYKLFCYKSNADIIDNIICVEATMGLRIIEALNPMVSSFRVVPDTDKVEQQGTAKMKKNKYVLSTDKVVPKTPIIITSTEFMKRVADVRADTAQYKGMSNVKMAEKYRENVNKRIVEYLREAKIPEHPELKSSHGLRRLWIAFAFATRSTEDRNMTLNYFIQSRLGHEDGGSTRNYDTIVIDSDKFLEKVASAKLDSTFRATINLKEEIKNLEQKVDDLDIPPAPVAPAKSANQIEIDKQRVSTKAVFKKIKELIDSGKNSYAEMHQNGVSKNIYAKYKRLHS